MCVFDCFLTEFFFVLFNYRFDSRKIYTYIGEVCVSVNPYRPMNIYGPDFVKKYKGESNCVLYVLLADRQEH